MGSIPIDLADAIVFELNKNELGLSVKAERVVVPEENLKNLQIMKISVVPVNRETEKVSRDKYKEKVTIDIGVQKNLSNRGNDEISENSEVVEKIINYIKNRPLEKMPNAKNISPIKNVPYYTEHLNEFNCFTSVITLDYILYVA